MKKILTIAGITTTLLTPLAVFAQATTPTGFCSLIQIVNTVAAWFGVIVFILAIIAMLYAAFLYLTGGGDEEKLKTARTVLIYGVVGIAIALLATNATKIIGATTGGKVFNVTDCRNEPLNQNLNQ